MAPEEHVIQFMPMQGDSVDTKQHVFAVMSNNVRTIVKYSILSLYGELFEGKYLSERCKCISYLSFWPIFMLAPTGTESLNQWDCGNF